jgi:hypothetical protein
MPQIQTILHPKINPTQKSAIKKRSLKLAFLTDWVQPSPFSEFSLSLVEEMFKLGHETFVVAPNFTEGMPKIPGREDGKGVFRFESDPDINKILAQLEEWEVTHLFVHKECFPDPKKLELLVQEFGKKGKSSMLFIHSESYDQKFRYNVFTHCIIPSRVFSKMPPGNGRALYLDQGIPELFDFEKLDLNQKVEDEFRESMMIPTVSNEDKTKEGFVLNTLDGKSDIKAILEALKYINNSMGEEASGVSIVGKKVYLQVHCANPANAQKYLDFDREYDNLILSIGYVSSDRLSKSFLYSEGAIFIYPDFKDKQTSAALRLCIGSLCPIITNDGNHIKDLPPETIMSVANNNGTAAVKHAIVSHFQRLSVKRGGARRMHKIITESKGWSKVAKTLEDFLLRK